MNVLTIVGRLGRDARTNKVGGTSVANFSVAAKAGYGDREQTVWVDCALWGQRAEGKLVDYLKKGQQVCVSGEMGAREHEGKTYITMRVNDLTLCGSRDESGYQSQGAAPGQQSTQSAPEKSAGGGFDPLDDDLPF